MPRDSELGEVGGGDNVPVVAALFRKGSALIVWREICWRLSASASGERWSVSIRNYPERNRNWTGTRHHRIVLGLDLRTLFLESGTSHSGEANSFSPSELLLWPSSGTDPLEKSLANKEGRLSSIFPSTARANMSQTTSGVETKTVTTFQWGNSHLCFCRGLVFGMVVRGWRALDVKLLRCLFSSGVTYGSSRVLRTTKTCQKVDKKYRENTSMSRLINKHTWYPLLESLSLWLLVSWFWFWLRRLKFLLSLFPWQQFYLSFLLVPERNNGKIF